jgi:hypothetical protein
MYIRHRKEQGLKICRSGSADPEPINTATLTCALRRSDINIHSDPFLYDFPLLKLNTQQKPPDEFVYLVH